MVKKEKALTLGYYHLPGGHASPQTLHVFCFGLLVCLVGFFFFFFFFFLLLVKDN